MTKIRFLLMIMLLCSSMTVSGHNNNQKSLKASDRNRGNKVAHLYKDQLSDADGFVTEFIQAYEEFFSKDARARISKTLQGIDKAELEKAALLVENQLQSLYKEFSQALPELDLPDSVLFIGDAVTDGHGIKVNDRWYLFIDLNTVVNQQRHMGNMKWFLAHELAHAIHYSVASEFFRSEYASAEDHILKYMMAEGIATWVSMKICDIPENRAFWGDFLDDEQISQWKQHAAENKTLVGQQIKKAVKEDHNHSEINRRLFYVLNMENLEQKRTGYLYGFEIIDRIASQKNLIQLLKTPYSEMRPQILSFFSVQID